MIIYFQSKKKCKYVLIDDMTKKVMFIDKKKQYASTENLTAKNGMSQTILFFRMTRSKPDIFCALSA